MTPLFPKHWHRVNPYARRVRTLRRSFTLGIQQILTSLKLYDRGSESPCIFPKLRCLIWNCTASIEELPLVANLFFSPSLKELHIGSHEHETSFSGPFSSLLVPLDILSDGQFTALRKLHLQTPEISGESLHDYHTAVIGLLSSVPEWQLDDISLILTNDILHLLASFSNLRSLELHDIDIDPSNPRAPDLEQDMSFQSLESLNIRSLRSPTSLAYLEHYHCTPSHRMRISFLVSPEIIINQHHSFYQLICLLSRKATIESLEVEGSFDLTVFLESLLAFSNLKELYLGPGIKFNVDDETLELMSAKWRNLTHLSVYENEGRLVSINGIASLHRCPIQSLRLSFMLEEDDIGDLRRRMKTSGINPLYSLKTFFLTNFTDVSDGDLVGTVLVLTYLFPHAEFIRAVEPVGTPSEQGSARAIPIPLPGYTSVSDILRIRNVVMELLNNPDFVRLIQTNN